MMAAASMASLAVSDATIVEGNGGIQYAVVKVSLSAPSTKSVQVNYNTADGTAKAGSDYNAASGTLTFAPGQTSKAILVPVTGDRLVEVNENFFVNLRGAKGAKIADGQAVVSIVDDEPRVRIDSLSAFKYKGDSGTTPFTFTVALSAAYDQAVTVNYATQDGTAIAGVDYLATSGTLTFAPGETTKTITVDVVADSTDEGNYKTFSVNLSGASLNALVLDGQNSSAGTIIQFIQSPNTHWETVGSGWVLVGDGYGDSGNSYDYYDFWGNGYMYSWEIGYYD